MAYKPLSLKNSTIRPHKAFKEPKFDAPTIIVENQFDYVELWLKRYSSNEEAVLYWQQAKNFYLAARTTPKESKPIVAYYCILNAAKTLLASKKKSFSHLHGLTGDSKGTKTSLANELSHLKGKGILFSLARYYDIEDIAGKSVTLKDVLYNLPFIHRAFIITYRNTPELFIPITNPLFVKQNKGNEAWFCAEILDKKYKKKTFLKNKKDGKEIKV